MDVPVGEEGEHGKRGHHRGLLPASAAPDAQKTPKQRSPPQGDTGRGQEITEPNGRRVARRTETGSERARRETDGRTGSRSHRPRPRPPFLNSRRPCPAPASGGTGRPRPPAGESDPRRKASLPPSRRRKSARPGTSERRRSRDAPRATACARDLAQPSVEAVEREAAHRDPRRALVLEQPPELLAGVGQMHEDEAAFLHRARGSSTDYGPSARVLAKARAARPGPLRGGERPPAFRRLRAPGFGSRAGSPCRSRSASASSRFGTERQTWWRPGPWRARNFPTGESAAVGSSSSSRLSPTGRNAVATP